MSSEKQEDPFSEPVILVDRASKTYRLYRRPADRLWQFLGPAPSLGFRISRRSKE